MVDHLSLVRCSGLELVDPADPIGPRASLARVEELETNDFPRWAVVDNHAWFNFVTFIRLRKLAQADVHRVVALVEVNSHRPPASTSERYLSDRPLRPREASGLVRQSREPESGQAATAAPAGRHDLGAAVQGSPAQSRPLQRSIQVLDFLPNGLLDDRGRGHDRNHLTSLM